MAMAAQHCHLQPIGPPACGLNLTSSTGAHLEADDVGVALFVKRHEGIHCVGAPVAAPDQQLRLSVRETLLHLRTF